MPKVGQAEKNDKYTVQKLPVLWLDASLSNHHSFQALSAPGFFQDPQRNLQVHLHMTTHEKKMSW